MEEKKTIATISISPSILDRAKIEYSNISKKVEELLERELGETVDLDLLYQKLDKNIEENTFLTEKISDVLRTQKEELKARTEVEQEQIALRERETQKDLVFWIEKLKEMPELQEFVKKARGDTTIYNNTRELMGFVSEFRNKYPELRLDVNKIRGLIDQDLGKED